MKKAVDFTLTHENLVDEILDRPADEAVAIAEGKSVLKMAEDEAFFRGRGWNAGDVATFEILFKMFEVDDAFS